MNNKKIFLIAGLAILVLVFMITVYFNYLGLQKGVYNWTGDGSVNGFFASLVMNIIEVVAIIIALFMFSRGMRDTRPSELTPVTDEQQ